MIYFVGCTVWCAKIDYPNSEVHVCNCRAYSACWLMFFLRTSSQSKSGTVPFWVQQTGHPNYLVLQMIFATFAAWREIYNAINNIHLRERTLAKAQRAQENGFIRHFEWLPFVAVCSVFVTFIADKVINLVCGVFIFAVHAISRVTIYCCVVNAYIYHCR